MKEEVHPGDGGRGDVLLLAVEPAEEGPRVAASLTDVLDSGQEHAAGAAGGVVDGLAGLRVEDRRHEPDDCARGVELARLLVGGLGEPLDEHLVGVAENVARDGGVGERDRREVLEQVLEQRVGQLLLVGPLGVAEHAVEVFVVGLLDAAERGLQRGADVGRLAADIAPVAAVRHLEPMGLREILELAVAVELAGGGGFFVPDVADALEEEERQDVAHPVGAAEGAAAKDVGGLPEVGFEGVERERGTRGGVSGRRQVGSVRRSVGLLPARAGLCLRFAFCHGSNPSGSRRAEHGVL